eukprot:TRINITY_DN67079_c0_g1_i1.p1 TRINITY_DN67079_c0_g1~~TRINITY_DN67079_c0_g1_i1.p1  ORF type:complete len:376 (-),score=72.60 TRINITY_DN67079_c0_g1_i1:90-1217(-)
MAHGCSKCDALLKAAEEHEWKLAILLGEWRITLAELRGEPTDPLASAESLAAKLRQERATAEHAAIEAARKLAEAEIEARKLAEAENGRRLAEAAREAQAGRDTSKLAQDNAQAAEKRAFEAERRLAELVERAEKDKSALEVVAAAKSIAEHRAEEAEKRLAEAMERAVKDAQSAAEQPAIAKKASVETTPAVEVGVDAEQELEEGCRTIFALCDPQGDRHTTVSIFLACCRKYDHIARFCNVMSSTDDEVYLIFGASTKRLDYDELKAAISKSRGASSSFMDESQKIDTIYTSMDIDGGGTISMHELSAFCIKHPNVAQMAGLGLKKPISSSGSGPRLARVSSDVLYKNICDGDQTISRAKFHDYVKAHRTSQP